jgi:hypothetical protein
MRATVYYAAYSYLDQWVYRDSRFHRSLAFDSCPTSVPKNGVSVLAEVAACYGVARTLKTIDEEFRLDGAYKALQAIEQPTEIDVVNKVVAFSHDLGRAYGSIPLSAASKFLWMRFRSPVVIYDSVVSKWLWKTCGYCYDGYANYYSLWLKKYSEFEEEIEQACAELTQIKKFTLACEVSDEQLTAWTSSRWFRERTFDHFMISEINTSDGHAERDDV